MFVQTKLQFQAVLDQVFPEFKNVVGVLYSNVSLKILQTFPTSEDILSAIKLICFSICCLCQTKVYTLAK